MDSVRDYRGKINQAMIEGLQEQIKQLKERNELMGAKDTADKAAE